MRKLITLAVLMPSFVAAGAYAGPDTSSADLAALKDFLNKGTEQAGSKT